jgi:hypothetical protein
MFTHCYLAELVLNKINKKSNVADFDDVDDYYFGAIAPDIRYLDSSGRDKTHFPFGINRVLGNATFEKYSKAFVAGYETHLVVDDVWSNNNAGLDESIYETFNVNVNDFVQKFTLYFLVDDYFQSKSNWFFHLGALSSIIRSDRNNMLFDLGFNLAQIATYKSVAALYLREPGLDTFNVFNFAPTNLDENLIARILNQKPKLSSFLNSFVKVSVEKCRESLERNL